MINFILTILISFIGFFQNKYFIQYMGIEILGVMKLFSQLLQYLNIIEMGIGSASTFILYKPLAEKDFEQISIIISTIKSFYNKIALILFLLGILVTPILPFFMRLETFNKMIYIYWILYLLNTVSTYLFIKYVILFTANQEFIFVRYIQSFSKIIFQILQIIDDVFKTRVNGITIAEWLFTIEDFKNSVAVCDAFFEVGVHHINFIQISV